MTDKVSIILPVYNSEKTIKKCIQSVINQKYTNWVLIVIDDGSIDSSSELLDKYASSDSRIRIIHKINQGVSIARNTGIKAVESELFVFLDSDDSLSPNYLAELIGAKRLFPDYQNIWCGYQSKSIHGISDKLLKSKEDFVTLDKQSLMSLYEQCFLQSPWNHLYSKSIVDKHSVTFRENLDLGEDLLFNLDYFEATGCTDILFINKPLYCYSDENSSSLTKKYRIDFLNITELLDNEFKKKLGQWELSVSNWTLYYNMVFNHYERALFNTFDTRNPMSLSEKIRFNNSILCKSSFIEALNNTTRYIHPVYRLAYHLKNYRIIMLANKVNQFIR